jgi:rubrerythrin
LDVHSKSNKKVWWICEKGHEWEANIYDRASGNNCPFCSSRKVCLDNCLATKNPDVAKRWHPTKNKDLTPYDVLPKSHKKVWWYCQTCGYEWEAIVSRKTGGCPKCSKKRRI